MELDHMSLLKEQRQSECAKIRQQVLNLIYKSGSTPQRLGSSREIAKEFGVAHTTVVRALKGLIDDGFVTVKPRVGAFTNPCAQGPRAGLRIFGLLFGDGKVAFLNRVNWQFGNAMADSLLEYDCDFNIQQVFLSGPLDQADKELRKIRLDGVIWILPTEKALPAIVRLKAAGMPVAVADILHRPEGVTCFALDYERDSFEAARLMLREGRRRIMAAVPGDSPSVAAAVVEGVARAHREAGLDYDRSLVFRRVVGEEDSLKHVLPVARPDGIVFQCDIRPLWKSVSSALDIADGCRLYSHCFIVARSLGYVGYVAEPQRTPAFAENMAAQAANPLEAPVLNSYIAMNVSMFGK
jgi:hypothetical protein